MTESRMNILQAPVLNLGSNHTACGPEILDAGNTGASYQWSTGSNAQTITVNSSGTYSFMRTGSNIATSLSVSEFKAALDGKPVTADFRIDDLKNPFLSLNAAADINLEMLRQFLPLDTLATLSGNASINISSSMHVCIVK